MKNHEHYDTPEALLNAFDMQQCKPERPCHDCNYGNKDIPPRSKCLARFAYEEYKPEIPDWLKPGTWVMLDKMTIWKIASITPLENSLGEFYLQFENGSYSGDLTLETLLRDYVPVNPPEPLFN